MHGMTPAAPVPAFKMEMGARDAGTFAGPLPAPGPGAWVTGGRRQWHWAGAVPVTPSCPAAQAKGPRPNRAPSHAASTFPRVCVPGRAPGGQAVVRTFGMEALMCRGHRGLVPRGARRCRRGSPTARSTVWPVWLWLPNRGCPSAPPAPPAPCGGAVRHHCRKTLRKVCNTHSLGWNGRNCDFLFGSVHGVVWLPSTPSSQERRQQQRF